MGTHIYMLWWSGETSHVCVHDSVTKESKLTALAFRFRWGGAAGGALGQVALGEPRQKDCCCTHVCLAALHVWIATRDLSACIIPVMEALSGGGVGHGRGFIFALPLLRLRTFDQAKVMFVRSAASVALTAVRNHACLGGEQILTLYLKQAKEKRSMAYFRP